MGDKEAEQLVTRGGGRGQLIERQARRAAGWGRIGCGRVLEVTAERRDQETNAREGMTVVGCRDRGLRHQGEGCRYQSEGCRHQGCSHKRAPLEAKGAFCCAPLWPPSVGPLPPWPPSWLLPWLPLWPMAEQEVVCPPSCPLEYRVLTNGRDMLRRLVGYGQRSGQGSR